MNLLHKGVAEIRTHLLVFGVYPLFLRAIEVAKAEISDASITDATSPVTTEPQKNFSNQVLAVAPCWVCGVIFVGVVTKGANVSILNCPLQSLKLRLARDACVELCQLFLEAGNVLVHIVDFGIKFSLEASDQLIQGVQLEIKGFLQRGKIRRK